MATNWQIGDRIQNRWEIHKTLKGGMGIVYVVYDHKSRESFAAKTFQDEVFARRPDIVDRFTKETLAWINLDSHQNVTEAQFVKTIAGKPYLFLEYVSGGDLSGWVGTPRLTEDLPQVLRFAIQFCDGMTHALSKGIAAHRDIKPQNCLITQDKTLKVTDFGLAKVFDDAGAAEVLMAQVKGTSISLTRTGSQAGTCTHMAPEQFEDVKHVDVRADIYSFGVMLYQMLTGRLPFTGRTWAELERMHKRHAVPALPGGVAELGRIVGRCLAKEAGDRYGAFSDVRGELAVVYECLTEEHAPQAVGGAVLNAVQWSNKGVSLDELGRSAEALECYARAIEINPRLAVAWTDKGNALIHLGQSAEALECYARAIEINPRDAEAWTGNGFALCNLGRVEQALACHARAIDVNPRYGLAWSNKGVVLSTLGRAEEALDCYAQAIKFNPRDEQAWYNQGLALFTLGRVDEALNCYVRAIEINPRYSEAWNNKGNTLLTLGRVEEALDCYDLAINFNPRNEHAWLSKGGALYNLGRVDDALECYARAIDINPQYSEAWLNKGSVLYKLGRSDEALECYELALEIRPRFAEAWLNKGSALYKLGQSDAALECYELALEIRPHFAEAWLNKGAVLVNSFQRYREALTCFEKSDQLGHSQAAQAIALCRQWLGRPL